MHRNIKKMIFCGKIGKPGIQFFFSFFLILVINELPRGIKSLPDLFLGNYISLFGSISSRRGKMDIQDLQNYYFGHYYFFFFI